MSGTKTLARYVSLITLLAFLNLVIGCTTNANISFDELEKKPGKLIPGVVLVAEIEGVTLRTGDEVKFDNKRGRYNRKEDWIRGVTPVGDSVEILLSDVEYVHVRSAGIDKPHTIKFQTRSFNSDSQTWKVFNGRSVRPGNVVKFGQGGARYDAESRLVVGTTKYGQSVEIDVNEILFAKTKKFNPGATIGLIAGILLIFTAIAAANPNIDLNWDWE